MTTGHCRRLTMCQGWTLVFKVFFSFNPHSSVDGYCPYSPFSEKLKQKETSTCPRLGKREQQKSLPACLTVRLIFLICSRSSQGGVWTHLCKTKVLLLPQSKDFHFLKEMCFWINTNTKGPIFIKTLEMNGKKIGRQCSILNSPVGYLLSGYFPQTCYHN